MLLSPPSLAQGFALTRSPSASALNGYGSGGATPARSRNMQPNALLHAQQQAALNKLIASPGAAAPSAAASSTTLSAPPLSPYSPQVFQRSLGLERRNENQLVALLIALAAAPPPASMKVSDPRPPPPGSPLALLTATASAAEAAAAAASSSTGGEDGQGGAPAPGASSPLFTDAPPPSAPPEAIDPLWQRRVMLVRRDAGAGREPSAAAAVAVSATAAAAAAAIEDAAMPLPHHMHRYLRPLDVALPAATLNDARYYSPFVADSSAAHPTHHHSVTSSSAAAPPPPLLRGVWDAYETLCDAEGVVTLSRVDLSAGARLRAFRQGVRAALLTARSEKDFHRAVVLLGAATYSASANANAHPGSGEGGPGTDPARLYPFLKLWSLTDVLSRKQAHKVSHTYSHHSLSAHSFLAFSSHPHSSPPFFRCTLFSVDAVLFSSGQSVSLRFWCREH